MGDNRNEIQSDNTRVVQKPIVLPIKHRLKPDEVFLTDRNTGEKILVKIPYATIGPDRRNDYQRQQGQNKAQQLYKQREEEREQKERMEALQGFFTFTLPSTYIGPVFNSNGKPYLDNVLSGEGSGSTGVNLAIDLLTPFGPKGINKGIKTFPKLLRRRLTVFQSPKNLEIQNTLTSHLQGEEAVKMFKQCGGVEIPEGSINGQQLRMYVPEARERYGLVGNTNITDEEIARALYKHSLELGQGTAAKNTVREPQLLFRGNTKDVPIFRRRKTPEQFVQLGGGTMDNSLGTLFLGELPNKNGDLGVYRYLVRGNDLNGNFSVQGAGAGNEARPIINGEIITGDITEGIQGNPVAKFPEGTRKVIPYRRYNVYKLPPNASSTGYNAVDAYIVRTPAVRDMTNEMKTIPGNPNEFEVKPFEWLVPKEQRLGLTEREVLGKQYQELLNQAQINNQGLLKSNKGTFWRGDEHAAYDYFALPNFNLQNIKHLLPYDLRIPRNWNDPNVYRTLIPVGVTTYGIGTQYKYGGKLIPHKNNAK